VIPRIVAKIGMILFGFNSEIYSAQLEQRPDGKIRDMELYFETFKFLFGRYVGLEGEGNKFCNFVSLKFCKYFCPKAAGSGEKVSAAQFSTFCSDRKIERELMYQMWSEINNDPYLARKKSFTSKTLWKAVQNNYDKRSERLENVDVETTLIQKM
jgi:hypothetical protein